MISYHLCFNICFGNSPDSKSSYSELALAPAPVPSIQLLFPLYCILKFGLPF